MAIIDRLFGKARILNKNLAHDVLSNAGVHPNARGRILSLEQELELAWDYVQKKLYCFDLPYPQITDPSKVGTASIDMQNHQILINNDFINYLLSKGMDRQNLLRGLLMHEAGHFKIMPWDLKNLMLLQYETAKICQNNQNEITNYFMDVSLNLELILSKRESSIYQVYYCLDKTSRIDLLMAHLYSFKTGMDFNVRGLPFALKKYLNKLSMINFADKQIMFANASSFASIIKDLFDNGSSEKKLLLDDFNLGSYSFNDIDRALKEIAREHQDPGEYLEIYSFVKNQRNLKENKPDQLRKLSALKKPGSSSINEPAREADDALINFYSSKAESYEIGLREKQSLAGGAAENSNLKSWDVGESYNSVDIFNSYGRFIPEISKSWSESGCNKNNMSLAIPDLVLVIDSSASMSDPKDEISYAALGGVCAVRNYLKRGSRVAVANFSSLTKISNFSGDYHKIVNNLLNYQGGSTDLSSQAINKLVKNHDKEVDIVLISDGFISDFDSAMKLLCEKKQTNRITILEICSDDEVGGFSLSPGIFNGTTLNKYTIRDIKDIPGIIIGDLNRGVV